MSLKYIITGTGRCATMFMAKFLTSAKIECGHELIFTNAGIKAAKKNIQIYNLDADASYMAAPYLTDDILKDAKIIHLVREPMNVINSFLVAYCYFLSNRTSCEQVDGEWTYEYPPGADPDFKFMKFIYSYVPALCDPTLFPVERAALYYIEWNRMIESACRGRNFLFYPIESDISNVCKFIDVENYNLHNDKNTNKSDYKELYTLSSIRSKTIRNELIKIGKKYGYAMRTPIIL